MDTVNTVYWSIVDHHAEPIYFAYIYKIAYAQPYF